MTSRTFDVTRLLYSDELRLDLESQKAIAAYRSQGPDPDGHARFPDGHPQRKERLERLAAGKPAADGKPEPTEAQVACAKSILARGRTWYDPASDPDPWPYLNAVSSPGIPWPGLVAVPLREPLRFETAADRPGYFEVRQADPNGVFYGFFWGQNAHFAIKRAREDGARGTPEHDASRWGTEPAAVKDGLIAFETVRAPWWDAHDDVRWEDRYHPTPEHGAILTVEWAVEDRSYSEWFASVKDAREALEALAEAENGDLSGGGWRADLTAEGCHTSRAYITRISARQDPGKIETGSLATKTLGRFSRPDDGFVIFFDFEMQSIDWRQLGSALPAGSIPVVVVAGPHRLDLHALDSKFKCEWDGAPRELTIDEYHDAIIDGLDDGRSW